MSELERIAPDNLDRMQPPGWRATSREGKHKAHRPILLLRRDVMNFLPMRRRYWGSLEQVRQDFDDLIHRFLGEPFVATEHPPLTAFTPRVDVEETDKEICVKADLPGVDPKDVEVTVGEGVLIVKGEKKEEKEEKKKNYHCVERFIGQFYRQIGLPPGAATDKIVATGNKGVITITIPKKPEVQTKKIPVTAQV
jgi:HSP20 family protein